MANTNVAAIKERLAVSDEISQDLSVLFRIPTTVMWNRLEGRPRSADLSRPLRGEVRDPLWMLARQWQMGEFAGEDAGSPIKARLFAEMTPLSRIRIRDGAWKPYDGTVPPQALVERGSFEPDLVMSLYIGQRMTRILALNFGADAALVSSFRAAYAFTAPSPVGRDLIALQLATSGDEMVFRRAVAHKGIDGAAILLDIARSRKDGRQPSDAYADRGVVVDAAQRAALDSLSIAFLDGWYGRLLPQPQPGEDAWLASHLEYRFSLGVTTPDGVLTDLPADRFAGGHFDWYSVDAAPGLAEAPALPQAPALETRVASFVPTPVRFRGAPNARWWEFEDRLVGFGLTSASKTDLVKMLLAEFGLVFSNDWFIVPFAAKVGTLVDTKGIVVTDNFGFNTLVEPSAKRHAARRMAGTWGMWTLSRRDQPGTVDTRFFLAPTLAKSLSSSPLDEVAFLRDETANLVWGIETITPHPLGGGRDARGNAKQLRDAIAKAYPVIHDFGGASDILLAYQLMGRVPEDWIPFVSVRVKDAPVANAFVQGAMPRVPPLDPIRDGVGPILAHNVVLPRGTILERNPVDNPNVINEEEILRGGALVDRRFEQARWLDGSTWNWSGKKKHNGRGEGSSGLAFDQAVVRKSV